ncbi:6-hydroxymethylpterin diphosphokinase MptE-like protein [Tepidimonas thermarum]|nr:6-hydroxymethylpterin diphosphokinase MptE-like protein [Tepidimonas thermarum]
MTAQAHPNPSIETGADTGDTAPPWRVNRFGERVLDAAGGELFDKLGARLTLKEAFRGQLEREDTFYLVAGSDSGHLIDHVKQLSPPPGTRYLFIDPPAVHQALADAGLLEGLPPHIRCASVGNWVEAAQSMRLSDYLYIDRLEVVFSLAAQSPDVPIYVELAWDLQQTADTLRWQALAQRGSEAYIACQLDNAADNITPAGVWRGALAGRTGVILAGGPSLDAMLDWVRQHRHQLVILAVSRISRRLLEVGLEPDFVVSADPTRMSYEISREMLRFGEAVSFVNQYHVHPRLLSQWPHRSYYLGPLLPWSSPLNPVNPLVGAGPTVASTALEFAAALGLSRVILAGVDLCFTPEGFTHARGSNERKAGPRFDLTPLEVETNDGRKASTTADFASAAQMLEAQAQRLAKQGLTIVNPAPGAVRIPGITHRSLDDIALEDTPLQRPLRADKAVDTPQQRLHHVQAVIRALQSKQDEIQRLEADLRDARRIVAKVFDQHGVIHNRNLRKRLDRLEAELQERYAETSRLIQQCGVHAFLRAMRSTQDMDNLDGKAVQDALAAYYDTYLAGAQRLRHMIDRALERARWRAREYRGASIAELAPAWLAAGEPGRVVRWLRAREADSVHLSATEAEALTSLKRALTADLQQEDGQHLARARAHADLRAAGVRLVHLLGQRDRDGIRNLIAGLEQAPDAQAASPYLALARGMLAELEDRTDEALGHYDAVLQSDQRSLWPTALLRIAGWALTHGQTEHAKQALECLAGLSPRYRPQYADVLAATGDLQAAIDVVEQHLASHPGDLHAMVRLARLMLNAGSREAAQLMLDHVESQPDGAALVAPLRRLMEPGSAADPNPR